MDGEDGGSDDGGGGGGDDDDDESDESEEEEEDDSTTVMITMIEQWKAHSVDDYIRCPRGSGRSWQGCWVVRVSEEPWLVLIVMWSLVRAWCSLVRLWYEDCER